MTKIADTAWQNLCC